ncbi:MAG: helix-turn-helix domain-containing protein [Acidobacteriota bacterium]|nr:helix-turn-helix domain-containing protein [Acidobacteriota bacterium]MDQ7088033.1 helix-turn-helix domain-containing protein [Acidobacteriota bacterium]
MPSFGETLRRQRELRQISLREVSEATKINIRYLEALERNDFTHLPGGAFTRGYIRSFARVIGVDESEMVDAYLYELSQQNHSEGPTGERGVQAETLAQHFSLPRGNEEERRRRARILAVIAIVLLTLAIVGGGGWALYTWLGTSPAQTQNQEALAP